MSNYQPASVDETRWLTASEAARRAGISVSWVSELSRKRRWPSLKFRGTRWIDRTAFEAWLNERRAVEEQLR